MPKKLTLTGRPSYTGRFTYGVRVKQGEIIEVSDKDAVFLESLSYINDDDQTVPFFTVYSGGLAANHDLTKQANYREFRDGSMKATEGGLASYPDRFPAGQLVRDRSGMPMGYSNGSGGLFKPWSGLVAVAKGVSFNKTTDTELPIFSGILRYRLNKIVVTNPSISLTTAAGGVYTAPNKGGVAVVAAGQTYSALNAATVAHNLTLVGAAANTAYTARSLYLSLTTAQGAAALADVYVFADDLT